METMNELTPAKDKQPITDFVVTLGRTMLREKVNDWLEMDGVARFCKQHHLKLNGECPGADALETHLKTFLGSTGEYYGEDVNVDGYERPQGWNRPFMVRAFPYRRCTALNLGSMPDEGVQAIQNN